jgi:hypothetical protein
VYVHAEAYALMRYKSDDGLDEEIIWNSRDGVTPFVITLRSGKQATHVDWNGDFPFPNYQPPLGSRMFVDLTEKRARSMVAEYIERNREFVPKGMSDEEVTEMLVKDWMKPGAPDLVEVTE